MNSNSLRRTTAILLLATALGSAGQGCKHEPAAAPVGSPTTGTGGPGGAGSGGGGGTGGGGGSALDTSLCFERDILPIFVSNCARSGCHNEASAEEGFVFTSYATITSKDFTPGNPEETELYRWITGNGDDRSSGRGDDDEDDDDDDEDDDDYTIMPPPPNAPLSSTQIALIREWILRGAPNSSGCAPSGCDTAVFTFSGAVLPTLQTYCTGCHSGASPSAGIALNTHAGAAAAAASGRLLGAVNHAAGFSPMPQGGAKLSDCRIRQIEKWVAAGAPNN